MGTLLRKIWELEPTLVLGLSRLLIVLAVAFGLGWTKEQIAATYAILEFLTIYVNRSQVTPNSQVPPVI